ncbi:hypothetical protein PAECIP111802_00613 [Paenibacillus allorhizosphaerae]|uniref:Uncharacterized protein n=1 Tax=Paenibacillus allorhizosphaerae TaxID=2849866 RepID=A0ABM8VBG5_9BACL|nr:hypothetical protein PAECIP111802_00613 [Paenibacillus allorhizosphaerae]
MPFTFAHPLYVQIFLIVLLLIKTPYSTKAFRKVDSSKKLIYWLVVCIIAIVAVTAKLAFTSSTNILGIIIVSPISGLILGLIVTSLIFRKKVIQM